MDTLKSVRSSEPIKVLSGLVDDKSKIAYVSVELQNRNGAIIVIEKHSDDIVKQVLNSIDPRDSGYVFFASELRLDPLNNISVPAHRLATRDEVRELIEKHVPVHKLPILRMLDPVRRWHNFSEGSVVAIERPSGTYFRRVA
jgi:DNA-directed RNA polymerase subunit H (RpoH/RPB5)